MIRANVLIPLASAIALSATLAVHASATDPTAGTLTPQQIDQPWQSSVRKYDAERRTWLERVDATHASGPFRSDWSSLMQYHAPKWYEEARFGIFIHWG